MVERGNTKHGSELDEQMKHEVEDALQARQPNHVEEHRQTEPWVDDTDAPAVRSSDGKRERSDRPGDQS